MPAQGSLPPEEIIAQLREASKEGFPALEELPYTVKDVPAALEEYTSPAFFMIPPIDSQDKNTIYINNSALDASSLFSTLAHEGYPGHLYQTVYTQLLDLDPLNNELSATGYAEGWATYVEHEYGYSYLDESDTYCRLARLNGLLSLEVSALADIGVELGRLERGRSGRLAGYAGLQRRRRRRSDGTCVCRTRQLYGLRRRVSGIHGTAQDRRGCLGRCV